MQATVRIVPLLLLACAAVTGCNQTQAQNGGPQPTPEVQVALPVTKEILDYEEFPGRTEAVSSVEVKARATGYLDKVNFTDGAEVKKDDVLFEIDPRSYAADLNRAEASLVQAQAHLTRLNSDYDRMSALLPVKGVSREDFDRVAGDRAEAVAAVGVAKAGRELAKLNLSFTKVTAPISGRISRRMIDPGNLVKADDTPLTTIMAQDPIYAYFDLDERTTLHIQQLIREGKMSWTKDKGMKVLLGLANEEGVSREGTVNFADNRVDPDTGTWRLRGVFANDDRVLTPGMFVRVRLLIGSKYQATMIAEQALGTDQGQKFVYVVQKVTQKDAQGATREIEQVENRRVKVGRLQDGLRVITDGLKNDERVIISGLQRVRSKVEVVPKLVKMPDPAANADKVTK
jgi:RND family efflux transporter MFP subunit